MTGFQQLTFEEVSVNRIRSIMATLDNYRRTSEALHKRHSPSVRTYALLRGDEVEAIAANFPDNPEIQRWAKKFREYCQTHNLATPTPED